MCALLRDNVQHHLEPGNAGRQFEAIYRAVDVLGGQDVRVNARQLHTELAVAQAALASRPISELAVSAHTRAVTERTWPLRSRPSTFLVRDTLTTMLPWLLPGMRTLDQVFGNLIRSLLDVTASAGPEDVVEVHDT